MRPLGYFLIVGGALFLIWLWLSAAHAHAVMCGPRGKIVESLSGKYSESVAGHGVSDQQQTLVELYVSPAGSWSLLVSRPQASCIIGTGENWERVKPPSQGEKIRW